MFKFLLLVALIPALAMGQAFPARPCAGGLPAPTQVRIVGCTSSPCRVVQGQPAQMQLDFTTRAHVTALTPTVHAHLGSSSVQYPLPPQFHDACNALGARNCPVPANTPSTFHFNFPIAANYPPIRLVVQVTLNSPAGVQTCALIDVQVVSR